MARRHWLLKTEPGTFSWDDLVQKGVANWDGVRNYKARNLLRDELRKGDLALIYHSNADPSAAVGIARVVRAGYPEPEEPTWSQVDVAPVRKLRHAVSLERMKATPALADMPLLRKGNRLSVQPVSKEQFELVVKLGSKAE